MAKMKVNLGTPQEPNWIVMDANNSDTVGGKSANDFLPRESGDTLPVASEGYRGLLFTKIGTTGEEDKVYACVKNSKNTYEWVDINSKDSETVGGKSVDDILLRESGLELPLADESYRGRIFTRLGDTGVLDEVYICIKNIEDAYEWKQITLV